MEKQNEVINEEKLDEQDSSNNEIEIDVDENNEDIRAEEENETEEAEVEEVDEPIMTEEVISNEELEKKLEETMNRLLRVQADYDNFRRRTRMEREADAKYRSQGLVEQLLPVLDNFERALTMTPESEEGKNFLQGMEMIYKQLIDALNKEGVSVIEAVGKPFDPHVHQAVMQVQMDDMEKDMVVEEFQKGYMLKDRVIRPSMVKVNA